MKTNLKIYLNQLETTLKLFKKKNIETTFCT